MHASWWIVWLTSLLGSVGLSLFCLWQRKVLEAIFSFSRWLDGFWTSLLIGGIIYALIIFNVCDLSGGQKAVWLITLVVGAVFFTVSACTLMPINDPGRRFLGLSE